MGKRVLVTGGAGFIGSYVVDELLAANYDVIILDSLVPQVHGSVNGRPPYLSRDAELQIGDVRDAPAIRRALTGVDAVVHLAALVGVGQSMYAIRDYTDTNDGGTANLMQALVERPVDRLVVASSMSVYGEGLCRNAAGELVSPGARPLAQLKRNQWEPIGDGGEPLTPVATPEWKRPDLTSIYALGKFMQERMCLLVGGAYGMRTTALRFFNVYGPRQALSNPYTGVLAIFASRLLNGRPPLVFEDGQQRRDFVHATDVARCCRLALEAPHAADRVFNVGSGENYSIRQLAELLAEKMGMSQLRPQITSRYRVGDIRHCFADLTEAETVLGYKPRIALQDGLGDLVEWVASQLAVDKVDQATDELVRRGLVA